VPHRDLNVLDAAQQLADRVNDLIDRFPRRLLHVTQLRDAVQSIVANIGEAFGRGKAAIARVRWKSLAEKLKKLSST
jgi:four helix bundle protein